MNRRSSGRGFRAIVADFTDRISRGELPPGTRLPAERALAAELGVNRSTVVAAYAELHADGLVERRQGSGTTVRGDLWGVAPDWPRYVAGSAFQPTGALMQRLEAARLIPGMLDLSQDTVGPDLMPRRVLEELLRTLEAPSDLGYPDRLGDRHLRETIAHRFAGQHGGAVDPDTILVTAGAQQALYLITRALLSPGDAVAIERPSYFYEQSLFQSAGVRLLPLPMDDEGVDPRALRTLSEHYRIRLVLVIPNYQNPTTTTLSAARRKALLATCRSLNIPVVEDDVNGELILEGTRQISLKAMDGEARVIHLGTLSQTAGPGLRIGWVIAPKPVVDHLASVKHQVDYGTSWIAQSLAARLLASAAWEHYLDDLRLTLRVRRDTFVEQLEVLGPNLDFQVPGGGMDLWVRWSGPGDDRQRLEAAVRAGVLFAPGRIFGAPDGYLRLTFAWANETTAVEAMRRLGLAASWW